MLIAFGGAVTVAAAAGLREPGLGETQAAAARRVAGDPAVDADRTWRARNAHWAPQLRLQGGLRGDEKARRGEFRLAPLVENDVSADRTVGLMLVWDLSQVVYAREESQVVLAHAHLARMRREAAAEAGRLWVERSSAREAVRSAASPGERLEALRTLLRLTAELDAFTGGLFREPMAREEQELAAEEGR